MKKNLTGTIFAVPLPDQTYLYGRVTLDIYYCRLRKFLAVDSPLLDFGKVVLLEMYREPAEELIYKPSPKLIQGAYVELDELGKSWPIVGNVAVDPREVEFPESVIGNLHEHGDGKFECGEIEILVPLQQRTPEMIHQYKTRHSAFLWGFTCLRELGRADEVPSDYAGATLEGADLRKSTHRKTVYKHLPFAQKLSYYEKQKILGHDLDRLYT